MGEQQTGAASVQNELRTGPRRCHVGVPLDLGETALWLVRGPPSIPAALWSPLMSCEEDLTGSGRPSRMQLAVT